MAFQSVHSIPPLQGGKKEIRDAQVQEYSLA